ncbi:helix-turn-helix domain-containing protein [Promicromonospora sp. NPDC050249]|uniref:TetR/AcrR family transcriptional regulator n=1 Tax=Promicromonospora sp. NPDC050249 TaxID=3154743 RepID=UPI0033C9850C
MTTAAATRRHGSTHRRTERAQRILEAARDLVLRWGYDKTTIDDVARRAGVAKGTIYLHWSSREDLFAALLRWDRAEMVDAVRSELHADPASATLPGLFAHLVRQIHRRPLLRAVLAQDSEVLGKLLQRKQSGRAAPQAIESFRTYLATLREHGMVRDDLSAEDHLTVLSTILCGSLASARLLPPGLRVSDDREGELLGDTVARVVATGRTPSDAALAAGATATREYVDRVHEIARAKLRESLGGDLAPDEGRPRAH